VAGDALAKAGVVVDPAWLDYRTSKLYYGALNKLQSKGIDQAQADEVVQDIFGGASLKGGGFAASIAKVIDPADSGSYQKTRALLINHTLQRGIDLLRKKDYQTSRNPNNIRLAPGTSEEGEIFDIADPAAADMSLVDLVKELTRGSQSLKDALLDVLEDAFDGLRADKMGLIKDFVSRTLDGEHVRTRDLVEEYNMPMGTVGPLLMRTKDALREEFERRQQNVNRIASTKTATVLIDPTSLTPEQTEIVELLGGTVKWVYSTIQGAILDLRVPTHRLRLNEHTLTQLIQCEAFRWIEAQDAGFTVGTQQYEENIEID
jgi:hypothetical protein